MSIQLATEVEHHPGFGQPLTRCAAGSDGDCTHPTCPQLRDSEPATTGRSCPIWLSHKDTDEEAWT